MSAGGADTIVYFDGKLMPATGARLPVGDRAVQFGFGFFETFRTIRGRPHLWSHHRDRLAQACDIAQLRLPSTFLAGDETRLGRVVCDLLEANHRVDAVFRYTVTAGEETGGPVELLVPRALPADPPDAGITMRVLKLRRDNGEWLPRPKSLNYANALLGRSELRARTVTPSDEGLFLSRDTGFVVETTHQNVAWIRDGCLCHPDSSTGCVAGTCLAWVVGTGVNHRACRAPLEAMLAAEAIVVMNAVRGLTPVRAVCGENDEMLVADLGSAADPVVIELRRRWAQALAATAGGNA